MSDVKLEDTVYFRFATVSPSTGALAAPSALPVASVYEDGVALGYAPAVANISTGIYQVTVVCSAANGFEAARRYNLGVTATVSAVAGFAPIAEFEVTAATIAEVASSLAGAASVGASNNTTPSSYTLTTGTQSSGTVADADDLNGVYHTHTDTAGAMDLYYEFQIGPGASPASVTWAGYLTSGNDSLEVHGYDWLTAGWTQIGTITGTAGATVRVLNFALFVGMVGTGANSGKVRVRFTDGAFTLTTATFATDRIYTTYTKAVEGYANGQLWFDSAFGNTGTVVGVDGTPQNPVSSLGALLTLAAATHLERVNVSPGSTLTLDATVDGLEFTGRNWTLALGGQVVTDCFFGGARISGVSTGAGNNIFEYCIFDNATLCVAVLRHCYLGGTLTWGLAGDYFVQDCRSRIAGSLSPTIDMGAAVGSTNLSVRNYSGGMNYENIKVGDVISHGGADLGGTTIKASCTGGSISIRGTGKLVVDEAGGAVAIDQAGYSPSYTPTAVAVAAAVWGYVVEGSKTAAEFMRLFRARLYGKATVPADDGTYRYRDLADTKDRIVAAKTGTARTISTEDGA